jgi:hypothetical protein
MKKLSAVVAVGVLGFAVGLFARSPEPVQAQGQAAAPKVGKYQFTYGNGQYLLDTETGQLWWSGDTKNWREMVTPVFKPR